MNDEHERVLLQAAELGVDWLRMLEKRPVGATATPDELRTALSVP